MMIAYSNTGIVFLLGTVGGDEVALGPTSMLYLIALLCILSEQSFVRAIKGHF